MGRTEPSIGRPPASVRKSARAKRARETLSKTIPAILSSNRRASAGVQAAELIVDPPALRGSNKESKVDPSKSRKGKGKSKSIGRDEFEEAEDEPHSKESSRDSTPNRAPPSIKVVVTDTLTAASELRRAGRPHSKRRNVAILNMASPLRAGGGFTSGATSQEEFLCMRTTLLPSLQEGFYRLPEVGGVWTPDVLAFRDSAPEANDLPQRDRYFIDVVTAGALRFPDTVSVAQPRPQVESEHDVEKSERRSEQMYASKKDAAMTRQKMTAVLRILQSKGCTEVVLGAWGCGAYGNPVGEIARLWKEVLHGEDGKQPTEQAYLRKANEKWFGLTDVVFAISQRKMAEDFATHWGGDIPVDYMSSQEEDEEGRASEEDSELEDLKEKIAQLEVQIENARTPMLRSGLQSVLHKLKGELQAKIGESLQEEDE